MKQTRRSATHAVASLVIASAASYGQFRPFDNARVERVESGEMRTLIGPSHPLSIVVQRPPKGAELTRYERWQWMFRARDGSRRLCEYLKKVTGLEAQVQAVEKPPEGSDGFRVYIGKNDWGVGQHGDLEPLDGHGFIIRTVVDSDERPALWIAGPTGAGTAFGGGFRTSG